MGCADRLSLPGFHGCHGSSRASRLQCFHPCKYVQKKSQYEGGELVDRITGKDSGNNPGCSLLGVVSQAHHSPHSEDFFRGRWITSGELEPLVPLSLTWRLHVTRAWVELPLPLGCIQQPGNGKRPIGGEKILCRRLPKQTEMCGHLSLFF